MASGSDSIEMRSDGTPVIAGSDVAVQTLLEHLQAGGVLSDFVDQHPSVDADTAVAVMALALEAMEGESGGADASEDEGV
jgi:uncharacterized protein (DUF433 family)